MHYRWFANDEDRRDEMGLPKMRLPIQTDREPPKKSRAERSGLLLSVVCLAYGLYVRDIPVLFVAVAFLSYELSHLSYFLGEKWGKFCENMLKSFSIALFVGAIILLL